MHGDHMSYACSCGDAFDGREALIDHNVSAHAWDLGDSRRAVMEKYPE
jgi:hypothetical protein